MKQKHFLAILLGASLLLAGCAGPTTKIPALEAERETISKENTYLNYLTLDEEWENYGIGDPYILKYNGIYYLYASTPYGKTGIKVWKSQNAFDWEYCGLMAEDQDATFTAYSPKVIYSNGVFYLYTTPDGKGLHILTASSPVGPFTDVTGRIHDCIDACIFIDDDGSWYLGHGNAISGIEYHRMKSPTEIEPAAYYPGTVIDGNCGNNWTETGEIFKRDDLYFMTYSGNHVANDSYRTEWASSRSVLRDYVPGERPLLTSTQGTLKGTGCGLVFTGADLISDYVVYHNLVNPNIGPIRHLNIDAIAYNGGEMSAFGPTAFAQEKGRMPTGYDFLANTDQFTGLTEAKDGLGLLKSGETAVFKPEIAAGYVAEMNFNPGGGDAVLGISSGNAEITVTAEGKATVRAQGKEQTAFLADYMADALHTVRVDFQKDRLQVYVDGMRKADMEVPCVGGKLSYSFTKDGKVGYTAYTESQKYSGPSDRYLPYTGKFFAKDYAPAFSSAPEKTDCERNGVAVRLSAGDYLRYRINTGDRKLFSVAVRYRADSEGELAAVSRDGQVNGSFRFQNTNGKYTDGVIENVSLEEGLDMLTLAVLKGKADISSFRLYPVERIENPLQPSDISENGFRLMDGKWTAINGRIKSYDVPGKEQAHVLFGSTDWADYEASVQITMDKNSVGRAGLLVRTANCAANTGTKHQIFAYNDQSYYVYLDTDGKVGIQKHNYNSVDVAEKYDVLENPYGENELTVTVKANTITVKVNGNEVLAYTDTACPYLTGCVGLHSEGCTAIYSHFMMKGV